jgi:hypothetical protein
MADRNYPQLPSAVWWKLRDAFNRRIPAKINESYLASILSVGTTAARQYLRDLKSIGLVNEDDSPSELVVDWRDDEKYRAISQQMLNSIYPDELLASAHPPNPDRQWVVRWFMQNLKIGEGAAGNKAAFYILLASGELQKLVQTGTATKGKANAKPPLSRAAAAESRSMPTPPPIPAAARTHIEPNIQLNIQIHISADATNEQIDAIFASMATHLRPR